MYNKYDPIFLLTYLPKSTLQNSFHSKVLSQQKFIHTNKKITKMITSTTVTVLKVIYELEIRKFCIYQIPVSVYLVIRVDNLTSLTSGL